MNTKTHETLGSKLKKYRMAHILTQGELAEKIDVSRVTISQIENGNENVKDLTRARIENFLAKETAAA